MPRGVAIKISADLAEAARVEAEHSDRSLTGQIEHWAKLGQVAEHLLPTPIATALKRTGGDLDALENPEMKQRVLAAFEELRFATAAELRKRMGIESEVRYEPDPEVLGGMIRITPDGKRTAGMMKGRKFVSRRA